MRESEAKYHSLFDSIDEGFCLIDMILDARGEPVDYRFLETNAAFDRQNEFTGVVGKTVLELVPDIEKHWLETYGRVARTGEAVRFENNVAPINRWFDIYAVRVGAGSRQIAVVFRDITERKRREANHAFLADIAEEMSRLSIADEIMQAVGAKLGAYLNLATCNFQDVDEAEGVITVCHSWASPGVPSALGTFPIEEYASEWQGASRAGETTVVRDSQTDPRTDARRYAELQVGAFVGVPFHRHGEWKFFLSVTDTKPRDWLTDEIELFRELSNRIFPRLERARAEEVLRESEENYRVIVNQSVAGIFKMDLDGRIIFSNKRFCEMLGYDDCEELLKAEEMVYAEDAPRNDKLFERLKNKGQAYQIEKRLIRKDGSLVWVNNQVSPIFGGDGKLRHADVVSIDITESKQAENERQKFVSLAENSAEFIGICDMDFLPVYVNEAGAKMVGLENREAVRQISVGDFFFAEDRDYVIGEFFPRVLRDGAGELEIRLRHFQTNEPLWMIFTAFLITNADGQTIGLGTASRNITERKRAEERLRTSEEWLRQATEAGRVFVWEIDLLKQTAKFSDNVERVLGFPLPTNLEDNFNALHPEDRERQREVVERAIATGGRFDEEHRISNPSGGASVWVRASGAVVVGADGRPVRLVGTTRNISERKQAEEALRQANDELERRVTERTQELTATLAALQAEEAARKELLHRIVFTQEDERRRIARDLHDQFGQGLTAMTLKLRRLKEGCGEHDELCGELEALEADARQLDRDVNFLVWELRPTALDDFGLQSALTKHARNWSKHSGVEVELHASGMERDRLTPEIETTLYRIAQEALNNIAKHAHAENVGIILERNTDHVSLIIEDNGVGFNPDDISGRGNGGFGLTGMRERAALLGGTVIIESHPGNGVTVFVRIPAPRSVNRGRGMTYG